MLHLLLVAISIAMARTVPPNLVVNGDFSRGNQGFFSEYTLSSDVQTDGNYFVGPNPHDCHPGGATMSDHTTGTGPMLIVNGSPKPQTLWQETIKVQPGKKYTFGLWAASWSMSGEQPNTDCSPARLVVYINGKKVCEPFKVNEKDGAWSKLVATWKSGRAKSAIIRIVDINTEGFGNDFAVDDIVFHN